MWEKRWGSGASPPKPGAFEDPESVPVHGKRVPGGGIGCHRAGTAECVRPTSRVTGSDTRRAGARRRHMSQIVKVVRRGFRDAAREEKVALLSLFVVLAFLSWPG